jgi:uncharacterized ferritin-like protein (DUF455 family)
MPTHPDKIVKDCLYESSLGVLATANAREKALAAQETAKQWREKNFTGLSLNVDLTPPDRPARPLKPELRLPKDMPKRSTSKKGQIALLHAVAHIELNAIDLAWDMVARFGEEVTVGHRLSWQFLDDWVRVGDEEAKHFLLLSDRLETLGAQYGDLPAHDGLWEAAYETKDDLLARLVIVPMVLEARGLDVTPKMTDRLKKSGDQASADILGVIFEEEIGHVEIGTRWFHALCHKMAHNPERVFQDRLSKYFKGSLKPPFNIEARDLAGLPKAFYMAKAEIIAAEDGKT